VQRGDNGLCHWVTSILNQEGRHIGCGGSTKKVDPFYPSERKIFHGEAGQNLHLGGGQITWGADEHCVKPRPEAYLKILEEVSGVYGDDTQVPHIGTYTN
jgi:hypothetical protein